MNYFNLNDLLNNHSIKPEYSVFDFVTQAELISVPAKNKKPLTCWSSKGEYIVPSDQNSLKQYEYEGVTELLLPTELNRLVVLDCDVVQAGMQNYPLGLINLVKKLYLLNKYDLIGERLYNCCNNTVDKNSNLFQQRCIYYGGQDYISSYLTHDQVHYIDIMNMNEICDRLPSIWHNAVLSPSGGIHFYFRCPNVSKYKSNAGVLADHVDIRAKGGVITCPLSYRERRKESSSTTGKIQYFNYYYPLGSFHRDHIPELPASLAPLLSTYNDSQQDQRKSFLNKSIRCSAKTREQEKRNIQKWLENVYSAPKGNRDNALAINAGRAFRTVAHGNNEDDIMRAFEDAGITIGLSKAEVKKTLDSARNYGLSHPFP